MSFNITGFDPDVFNTFNSAIQIILFVALTIPAIVLLVVSSIALLLAKTINWQMKTTLLNIFAAEIVTSIGIAILHMAGYPIRVKFGDEKAISCNIGLGLTVFGSLIITTGTSLYAITVYIFIKCGPKKMKVFIIAAFITISWIVYVIFGAVISVNTVNDTRNSNGFCVYETADESAPPIIGIIIGIVLLVNMCVVSVLGILTYIVRRSVSEAGTSTKKALTKILLYLTMRMAVILGEFIFAELTSVFRPPPSSRNDIIGFLAVQYILVEGSLTIFSLLTPIVSIIILKPVRNALQLMCTRKRVPPTVTWGPNTSSTTNTETKRSTA